MEEDEKTEIEYQIVLIKKVQGNTQEMSNNKERKYNAIDMTTKGPNLCTHNALEAW